MKSALLKATDMARNRAKSEEGEMTMRQRVGLIAMGLVLLLATIGLAGCAAGTAAQSDIAGITISNQAEGIQVTGEGVVSAVPDIVELRLGIEAQADTVAEAQTQAAEAMNRVMEALADNGIAEKQVADVVVGPYFEQ